MNGILFGEICSQGNNHV